MTGKRKLVMALTAVLALTGGISGQAASAIHWTKSLSLQRKIKWKRKYCRVVSKEKKPLSA